MYNMDYSLFTQCLSFNEAVLTISALSHGQVHRTLHAQHVALPPAFTRPEKDGAETCQIVDKQLAS